MNLIEWPYYRTEFLASQGLSGTFPERLFEKLKPQDECLVWTGYRNKDGYGRLFAGSRKGATISAHVGTWIINYGPIPVGLSVLHRCDNPPCCRPTHLWLGTKKDNTADMINKGRNVPNKGESNGRHKLTESQVSEILRIYAVGEICQHRLAMMFNVSDRCINFIVKRQHWVHVPHTNA